MVPRENIDQDTSVPVVVNRARASCETAGVASDEDALRSIALGERGHVTGGGDMGAGEQSVRKNGDECDGRNGERNHGSVGEGSRR